MRLSYNLKVIQKRPEAKNAVTLRLEVPSDQNAALAADAGQFVGVTAVIGGEEVHRSYSLSSSPLEKFYMEISIKKIEGGKMSTYLVDELKEGDDLEITPPAGSFYKDFESRKHHVMFAAGSGVTPMISIIKYLKAKKPQDQISLFYWNKNLESTMFRKELEELNKKHNLNLFLNFTQEQVEHESLGFLERCSEKVLKSCFYKWSISLDMPVFYLCGPEEFMATIEHFLGTKGYDHSQIRKESFNIGEKTNNIVGAQSRDVGPILVGDLASKTENLEGAECEALLDGDEISVLPEEGETILEAFLRDGESPPYSCMEGTCMACQCKVLEGLVEIPRDSFISQEEIDEGLVLSCQAMVKSKKVKVNFDDV